jgi:hypothetical protein
MGNQQKEGVHYQLGELYAAVMKAAEVRLFMAIAAKHGFTVFKSDTKEAFPKEEIGDERFSSARASTGWPCPTTDEEYVRDAPGSSAMACADIHVDGGSRLCSSKQREDHFHEA